MNCSQIQERTAEYLAGDLDKTVLSEFEAHLADCITCRESMQATRELWMHLAAMPETQPSPELRSRFSAILEAYHLGESRKAHESFGQERFWRRWANLWPLKPSFQAVMACIIFLVGVLLGPWISRPKIHDTAISSLRSEVGELRQLVALTLLQQPSASDRLEGVSYSQRIHAEDDKVLSALLKALETDPNVNVRVAVVDAIRRYANHAQVKQGLLRSLAKDDAPLVQIELIDLLVQLDEKSSIPMLRQIMQNPEANLAVRQRAEWGLQKLI